MLAHEVLLSLNSKLAFEPVGGTTGNLTLGRGKIAGVPAYIAIVENKIASGSLGAKESDKLASLFKVVTAQKAPLVMYLDSAGARVSEGLPALGAFRHMYRAALAMAASGAPTAAYCGANCFGGASMLAALAGTRYYAKNTRFAMSGPAILAQSAGVSVLDEMFQAMSLSSIGADARIKLSAENLPASFGAPLPAGTLPQQRHAELQGRLAQISKGVVATPPEKVQRKDLEKLYPSGYDLVEKDGLVSGEAVYEGAPVSVVGLVGGRLLGAVRACDAADMLWKKLASPPKVLHLLVDCASHATALDDERVMLSAYLADLACAIYALAAAGTHIETTVLEKLGGGVYVALSAASTNVNLLYGADIQLLPGAAIASILGDAQDQVFDIAEYQKARVAERELKLGIV
ncbi:MAG: carboxyl transferase domain-containing protein [Betaproteobacteria bacterium]